MGSLEGSHVTRIESLDRVKALCFNVVSIIEKHGLVNAENLGIKRSGMHARLATVRGYLDGSKAVDAVECHEEKVVDNVEPNGRANAHF